MLQKGALFLFGFLFGKCDPITANPQPPPIAGPSHAGYGADTNTTGSELRVAPGVTLASGRGRGEGAHHAVNVRGYPRTGAWVFQNLLVNGSESVLQTKIPRPTDQQRMYVFDHRRP